MELTLLEPDEPLDLINFPCLKRFNKAELYYQLSNCYYLLANEKEGKKAFDKASEMNSSIQKEMFEKYPILENKLKISAQKSMKKK